MHVWWRLLTKALSAGWHLSHSQRAFTPRNQMCENTVIMNIVALYIKVLLCHIQSVCLNACTVYTYIRMYVCIGDCGWVCGCVKGMHTETFLFALQVVIWSCLVGDLDSGSVTVKKTALLTDIRIHIFSRNAVYTCAYT